jgi:hypothetical protein
MVHSFRRTTSYYTVSLADGSDDNHFLTLVLMVCHGFKFLEGEINLILAAETAMASTYFMQNFICRRVERSLYGKYKSIATTLLNRMRIRGTGI